jgi:hypothetical protein
MENKQFTPKVEPPKTPEKKTEFFDFSPEQTARMAETFFGLTEEELAVFKNRIAKNEGHVRIFVHPFYVSAHPESYARRSEIHGYDDISQEEAAKHLEEGFLKTVRSVADNKDSAPLIIFEEESQIEETRKTILEKLQRESLNFAESGIIFSPTEQGRGAPHRKQIVSVYENVREPAERSEVFYEAAQKIYEEILSTLNIQSGTMGGAYFDDWYRPGDELGACAGNVRKTFNHLNIPINLSRYTISPREQLKKHYPTKQTREKDSQ